MNPELLNRGLGAQRRSGLVWGGALLALAATVLAVWPSMSESGSLDELVAGLSPDLIGALGLGSLASPTGFLNGNLYALLLPFLVAVLAIMHTSTLTAGDEDAGRLELLLALPVSRTSVYLSRFVSVVLVLAVVMLAVGLTVGLGAVGLDMDLDVVGVVAATVGVFLLGLFHAAVTVALAGLGLRAGIVLAGAFAVLVVGYLLHALLPAIEAVSGLAQVSPWAWALGGQPLDNGFDVAGVALLVGASAVLVAVGLVAVRRRTIRTA